ncbi:hypothetical protein D3C75_1189550 [compost metagenome]
MVLDIFCIRLAGNGLNNSAQYIVIGIGILKLGANRLGQGCVFQLMYEFINSRCRVGKSCPAMKSG